jgi:hypothetical protein
MKYLLVTLLFLVQFCSHTSAQITWQVGTTWHLNSGSTSWPIGILYTEMKLVKDTILGGLSGFELSGQCNCIFADQPKFVRQADRKTFYWDDTQWELLSDFNLQAGDSVYIRFKGVTNTDSTLVVIDSVGTITTNNGMVLQTQYISQEIHDGHNYTTNVGYRWIEGIGSDLCLFPQGPTCDPNAGMVCFDGLNGLQMSWSGLSCDEITSVETPKLDNKQKIKIQPNPFEDNFQLMIPPITLQKIEIIGVNGQKYTSKWTQSGQTIHVEVKDLDVGLYFLRLFFEDNTLISERIMKI